MADGLPGVVPVRDSKDPHGPVVLVPSVSWAVFVEGLKSGH
ncbi:DUF397 domain-containing protein [Streptomyces sp. DSM 42041]|uniref:DUF397 domain-containing protein n=1 Tax=Streptomyces hazeniae TaxID=3075538 RepID=A0ABU2NVH5_9ACTN|nr:DUF397 domain-containing protein [Streptomyces sp. DSM 42041]MDT0380986.1 DUF397 domain-containing protein [Streptomyces sp. DSM 42041]